MSRFNTVVETKTKNLAHGDAYLQSPEMELVSILLTSFANEQFYRGSNETFETLKNVILKCDPEFVAKACVFARNEFGMRSITHVASSELAKRLTGKEWAKNFYSAIVHRPDDITEILSYHKSANGKIPNSMKKGLASSFDKFDRYQLAKYRGEGKGMKLVDAVNLLHPVPVERNESALKDLVNGTLKSEDTWEAMLSDAGSDPQKKKEAWKYLILERKLGYFALLRNLRNIIEQAPEYLDNALEMLVDERLIKRSLVLPFRFVTAYDEIGNLNSAISRKAMSAIGQATEISLSNVPVFDGNTLTVLDVSGSMQGKPAQIGSLFSAILAKSNNADLIVFSNDAKYANYNLNDSVLTIANSIKFAMGGTNFHSIFKKANKPYDRVIILSDMQGWMVSDGYYSSSPKESFKEYKRRFNCDPKVYSFDLQGYGSLQFPENKVFCIAGFSEKIFDIMKVLEEDRNALVNRIKAVEF